MRYIEHVIEPERLLLSWQAQAPESRMRHIVAELRRNGNDADLVYLRESQDYLTAKTNGFDGNYPGLSAEKNHSGVLAVFMRRLPPRDRTDFSKFLEAIRIEPGTDISDFALLGYAGGKLPGDDFYIIHPFDQVEPPFEFLMFVAGYRYYQQDVPYNEVKVAMSARFEFEPDNEHDPDAVRVVIPEVSSGTAGYVCRGLLPQFRKWMLAGLNLKATVERKNGVSDQQLVFLFVQVRQPSSDLCVSDHAKEAIR